MLCPLVIALVAAAAARVAAQQLGTPPPAPTEKPRVVNVTLLHWRPGRWGRLENVYGWVTDVVENDRTTIALDCSPSSTWVIPSRDPCFQLPTATVVVAPPASSTAGMTVTEYDYGRSLWSATLTVDCTFQPKDTLCHVTSTVVDMASVTHKTLSATSFVTVGVGWGGSITSSVIPVTITRGVSYLGPETTSTTSTISNPGAETTSTTKRTSNPGAPMVTARALLGVGVAALAAVV